MVTNKPLPPFSAQGEPCRRLQLGEQDIQEEQTKDKWHQKRLPETSTIQKARQQSAVSMANVSYIPWAGVAWGMRRRKITGLERGQELSFGIGCT